MNPVLKSIKPVVKDSKYVSINKRKLKKVAKRFSKDKLKIPDWRLDVFVDNDREVIDSFFLGNTINFAYRDFDTKEKFETIYRDELWIGAMAMFASLKRAIENGIPILDANYLKLLDRAGMRKIFTGNIEIPMLNERLEIFHEVGEILEKKYDGHFYNLVRDSDYFAFDRGAGMVERLVTDFPSFNDVTEFKGKQVKFYKRAQLAVIMAYGRLRNSGLFDIKDVDNLSGLADYELPKVLRSLGVMELDKDLEERIENQELIEKDSREEIELRANTIYACDLLIKEMNKLGGKVSVLEVDYKLWSEGRRYRDKKHHLTKTIFY